VPVGAAARERGCGIPSKNKQANKQTNTQNKQNKQTKKQKYKQKYKQNDVAKRGRRFG
jgi:hypothetical protein